MLFALSSLLMFQEPTQSLQQVQLTFKWYVVAPRFELTGGRFQRAKDGSVSGYVKAKSFDEGMTRLVENRRAQVISSPVIRTIAGMEAMLSTGSGIKVRVTPKVTMDSVSFEGKVIHELGADVREWPISGKLGADSAYVLQFVGMDRKTRLIRMSAAVISD